MDLRREDGKSELYVCLFMILLEECVELLIRYFGPGLIRYIFSILFQTKIILRTTYKVSFQSKLILYSHNLVAFAAVCLCFC